MNVRILAVAMAGLLCAGLAAQAQPRTAVAEIRGCTDATITGRAQLSDLETVLRQDRSNDIKTAIIP